MILDKYQIHVNNLFMRSPEPKDDELRIFLGIVGELGEVCELVKKAIRDGIENPDEWREKVELEIGDALFYVAHLCNYYDFSLDEILEKNIEKLYDRKDRDVLGGSGDFR